jgi:hypothetical protein
MVTTCRIETLSTSLISVCGSSLVVSGSGGVTQGEGHSVGGARRLAALEPKPWLRLDAGPVLEALAKSQAGPGRWWVWRGAPGRHPRTGGRRPAGQGEANQ